MQYNSAIYFTKEASGSWINHVDKVFKVNENNAIIAPRRSGKTIFIRSLIMKLLYLDSPMQNEKFFIISPHMESLKHIKRMMEAAFIIKSKGPKSIQLYGGITFYFYHTTECLDAAMRGVSVKHAFIDDANDIDNATLYNIFLNVSVCGGNVTAIGCGHERKRGEKSVWKWMTNHPGFNVSEVYMDSDEERRLIIELVECFGKDMASKILTHEYLVNREKIDDVIGI